MQIVRLEFQEKNLTLPKQEDIILNSITLKRKKYASVVSSKTDFYGMKMLWYSAFFFLFYFLFRTNGKKGHLGENNFPSLLW